MLKEGTLGAGALVDLVSDFYGASMDARFWPTALSKLREALEAETCAIAAHDFATGESILENTVGIDVDAIESYARFYGRDNAWLQREENFRSPGTVWVGAQLVADDKAAATDFYRNWLAPQGLWHQLFGVLDRQGSRALLLHAARTRSGQPFGADQVSLLERLLPYLQRGLRAGQMLRRTQNVRQAAMDALDVMPIGVVLVSAGGVVLGANRVARDVMANRDGVTIGRGGLEIIDRGRRLLLHDLVAESTLAQDRNRPAPPLAFSIARTHGGRPLAVLVWPVRELGRGTGWEDPAAVVFIGDPEHVGEVNEDRLRALYGLTGAEARVAALLARGYRLDEIAEMLGVAYETTRKHLKQIFGKTNTARQAELVRMVMTGPGGLAL